MIALWLAACAPSPVVSTPASDTSDTATTDTSAPPAPTAATAHTGTPLPPVGTAGDCAVTPSGAPLAGVRQAMLHMAYGVPRGLQVQWFADAASFDAFWWQDTGGATVTDPLGVDFDAEVAVVVTYGVGSSCGVTLDGVDVWGGDVPHVEVRIRDSSWGCEDACDLEWAEVVVLAVPRTDALTVCGLVGDGCDAGLP